VNFFPYGPTMVKHPIRMTLIATSCLTASCGGEPTQQIDDPDDALYDDVTLTHLPANDLTGLSMDARPADLDRDGDLDLVIASEFAPNILLINDGSGRFSNASVGRLPAASHDSEDVGIADFDGDDNLDIIIVSEDDQTNELYLNDGPAVFRDASTRLPTTGTSNAVQVADLNGDGRPDILIGNNGQNVILINTGLATFLNDTPNRLPLLADATQDLELGDVDGDGDMDLLVGNEDANRLLINDGSGIFADESSGRLPLRPGPEETREADFGDVDGDGDLDILFANVNSSIQTANPANRLLINDGAGFFQDQTSMRLPDDRDRSFEGDFADLDGDGDLDIITGNLNGGSSIYRVLLNDGSGVFTEGTDAVFPRGTVGMGFDVEAADFNGDGILDLFLASRGSVDRLLLGR
jgi:hypothetical protein